MILCIVVIGHNHANQHALKTEGTKSPYTVCEILGYMPQRKLQPVKALGRQMATISWKDSISWSLLVVRLQNGGKGKAMIFRAKIR